MHQLSSTDCEKQVSHYSGVQFKRLVKNAKIIIATFSISKRVNVQIRCFLKYKNHASSLQETGGATRIIDQF